MYKVIYGDIFAQKTDAIVLPASPMPHVGSSRSISAQIFKRAGRSRLLNARKRIGDMAFGEVKETYAYDYDPVHTKYIIHACTPTWIDGDSDEKELLEKCYRDSIELAKRLGCQKIVFPLLSSGCQHFPRDLAMDIANSVCSEYKDDNGIDIQIVIYSDPNNTLFPGSSELDEYLITHDYYDNLENVFEDCEKKWGELPRWREERQNLELMRKQINNKRRDLELQASFEKNQKEKLATNLDDNQFPSFDTLFFYYLDKSKFSTQNQLADKLNMSKSTISKILSGTREIKRDELWAMSIAFKLTQEETERFFQSADKCIVTSYKLSKLEIEREKIIRYYIEKRWYDFGVINDELDKRGMQLLAA